MSRTRHTADVLIVGAGMAGLVAARQLRAAAREVLVIDKGRGAGGRMASRRIGDATFDHGAQFLTVRDPRFAILVEELRDAGVAVAWWHGDPDGPGSRTRWRGEPSMTAIAKYLARGVPIELATRVVEIGLDGNGWSLALDSGDTLSAGSVLLTAPVPQSLQLLDVGGIEILPSVRERLESVDYERCLAVMAVLGGPTKIPAPGRLVPGEGPIAWIADNRAKGISATTAVTIHGSDEFSSARWERDRLESSLELLQAAEPWLGAEVLDFQVHGWRYSKPIEDGWRGPCGTATGTRCAVVCEFPPLVIAGDAFAGSRVEGAALSGWAAADALDQRLSETRARSCEP